jgi:hypothetical protein
MAGIRYVGTTRKVLKLKPKLWKLILTGCPSPSLASRDAGPQGLNSSARKFNFESFHRVYTHRPQSRPEQQEQASTAADVSSQMASSADCEYHASFDPHTVLMYNTAVISLHNPNRLAS